MGKRRPKGSPPGSERRRRLADLLATGVPGPQAAHLAGYTGARARTGVTAAEAKRDPWVQDRIARGREAWANACYEGLAQIQASLGMLKLPRGKKPALSPKEATHLACSRHVLQVAGLLAPDTTPPPTAGALADAILGALPPEKLGPLLRRSGVALERKECR